ncbi:uncharacterized protein G2W53_033365 [Senna tora]|uniref:Uncharacterized protein n=1 Tax=Senna tora TaxID=362788 RepID=A0A834WCR7_9FABA|nr:uncharacterized protein G2W53_033365 [Senna tora]
MNLASLDSISVTVPSSFSPMKTYPFDCSEYLIKIHFFPVRPSFLYLWELSSGVEAIDVEGTRLSMKADVDKASPQYEIGRFA